jgi:hypothetical protein
LRALKTLLAGRVAEARRGELAEGGITEIAEAAISGDKRRRERTGLPRRESPSHVAQPER